MKLKDIKSAALKALITADPHYLSWTTGEQERFRATMNEATQRKVDAVLLTQLLGISCTAKNADDIWREIPLSKLNNLNWAKLLTTGIGSDTIMLNESMADDTCLLDFDTLYDYDFDDYLFQERTNKDEFKDYQGRDYYPLWFSKWARLIINDQFYYATLYSLAGYLTTQLEDKGSDIIQTLIPHEYVDGKNHGKPEKGGFLWDMQVDASGLEKQLDELNDRWYQYTQQRHLDLSKQLIQISPAVYIYDKIDHNESHRDFIFNNESALKWVRWRYFLSDCEEIKADNTDVSEIEKRELAMAESWLQATHQDIMQNFDPDVIKLKRKRKIVVAPGAFDGLLGKDSDE